MKWHCSRWDSGFNCRQCTITYTNIGLSKEGYDKVGCTRIKHSWVALYSFDQEYNSKGYRRKSWHLSRALSRSDVQQSFQGVSGSCKPQAASMVLWNPKPEALKLQNLNFPGGVPATSRLPGGSLSKKDLKLRTWGFATSESELFWKL